MKRFGKTGVAIGLAVTMLMTQVPAGTVMAATNEVNTSEEVTKDVTTEEVTTRDVSTEEPTTLETDTDEITTDEVTTEEITAEEQSTEEITTEEVTTEEISTEELEPEDKESEGEIAIDEAHFPDANFRSYILDNVDTDKNGVLSQEERDACTEISVGNRQIQSLTGIEYFAKLEELWCYDNQLSSLDVSKNMNLRLLNCGGNQLSSLNVSKKMNLRLLSCYNNQLSSLDVSNCQNLTRLYCGDNQLSSLDVRNNQNLEDLHCYNNQLNSLNVSNNQNLKDLDCNNNQLSSLNVSSNLYLQELYCYNNQLSSLDVSNNQNLEDLHCYNNQLNSLNVSNNQNLRELYCSNNQLNNLDVSNNPKMWLLYCDNNPLDSIDLSKNARLLKLSISYHADMVLDVSNNQKLCYIYLFAGAQNQLLDLSGIKGLKTESLTEEGWDSAKNTLQLDPAKFEIDKYTLSAPTYIYNLNTNINAYRFSICTETDNLWVTELALDKIKATMVNGTTLALKPTIAPTNATNKKVSWSSSNEKVAKVDSKGNVTAVGGGTATITCKATDGSGVKASCKVTVPAVKVTGIKLNKTNETLICGKKLTLKPTITPSNATNKKVTWTSSNTKVAKVDANGTVTAVKSGTATITCKAADGSGKKATCKITVYTNTEAFVARIYTKALNRQPEAGGLAYWTKLINSKKKTPVQVAEAFFLTKEFQNKKLSNTEYVKVLYRTFMGREADKAGLNYWVGRLKKGESRKVILESFAGCQEFKDIVKGFGL